MLKFDNTHENINGSIKKQSKKAYFNPKLLIGNILLSMVLLFSGCAKTVDCDIPTTHAHVYVNEEGFRKNMVSEKESNWGFDRTEDYFEVTKEESELLKFMNKKGLMDITQNKEAIEKQMKQNKDYTEYRYSYTYLQPIPHTRRIGKTTSIYYTYIPLTRYSWTSNPNHSRLTGETRVVHYMYYGYKIVTTDKGKLKVIESELVDNINDLPSDYLYIKKDFTKKVYANKKNLEVDYEDGPESEVDSENSQETTKEDVKKLQKEN